MRHKQFKEWLQLSVYEELTEHEQALLDHHLLGCEECKNDLGVMKTLHATLAHRALDLPDEQTLTEARRRLREQIRLLPDRESLWAKVRDAVDRAFSPSLRLAAGGAMTLAVGILIGYVAWKEPSERRLNFLPVTLSHGVETGEPEISDVRIVDRDPQTGNVEFTFSTTTPVHIRGNVADEHVQKILARALVSDQNVGSRIRAVTMIGSHVEQQQNGKPGLDADVKAALIAALLHDRNLGVRKEALVVLRNYLPDPAVVRAFLTVLSNEKSTALKIAAINSLDLSKSENQQVNKEILDMLKHKAQSDDNNYIRIRAAAALQEVKQ